MTQDDAITMLRGRVRALLTQVRNNQEWQRRGTELWTNSRIFRELEEALHLVEFGFVPNNHLNDLWAPTHKGYWANVVFYPEDGVYGGRVGGIRDVVTFEGSTLDEAKQAFIDSVDDYLAMCGGMTLEEWRHGKRVDEDASDVEAGKLALAEADTDGTIPWEQVKEELVVDSSGNVFADLGFENAEELLAGSEQKVNAATQEAMRAADAGELTHYGSVAEMFEDPGRESLAEANGTIPWGQVEEELVVSQRDYERILAMCESDSVPNEALLRTIERYKRATGLRPELQEAMDVNWERSKEAFRYLKESGD